MKAEIWKRLPAELLFMILGKLPIRVLGKMRIVCKHWNSLLSSRDALQASVPNWSLHSTHGFLFQVHWVWKDDVEFWVIEGHGSYIYKLPLLNRIVVDTCKSIFCCHTKEDKLDLYIGIPGTMNWRHLPRPPIPDFCFSGLAFDPSTGVCTLLLGYYRMVRRERHGQRENRRIVMAIYDSESNVWTGLVSMMVPHHVQPWGKSIFSKGKFHWAVLTLDRCNLIVAFNIAERHWTDIPLPEGCGTIFCESLGGYDGKLVLVEKKDVDCLRLWKLNEEEKSEIWCDLSASGLTKGDFPLFPIVAVNNSGLIMVINRKMNMLIFNSKGKLSVLKLRLPWLHTSKRRPIKGSASTFESNNLWWP